MSNEIDLARGWLAKAASDIGAAPEPAFVRPLTDQLYLKPSRL